MAIIANPDQQDEPLSWSTHTTIETMLNIATIDDKSQWLLRLMAMKYEHEGLQMIEDLKEYMPIMGFHRIPVNVKEAMEATRIRIERDNFQEDRKCKDY